MWFYRAAPERANAADLSRLDHEAGGQLVTPGLEEMRLDAALHRARPGVWRIWSRSTALASMLRSRRADRWPPPKAHRSRAAAALRAPRKGLPPPAPAARRRGTRSLAKRSSLFLQRRHPGSDFRVGFACPSSPRRPSEINSAMSAAAAAISPTNPATGASALSRSTCSFKILPRSLAGATSGMTTLILVIRLISPGRRELADSIGYNRDITQKDPKTSEVASGPSALRGAADRRPGLRFKQTHSTAQPEFDPEHCRRRFGRRLYRGACAQFRPIVKNSRRTKGLIKDGVIRRPGCEFGRFPARQSPEFLRASPAAFSRTLCSISYRGWIWSMPLVFYMPFVALLAWLSFKALNPLNDPWHGFARLSDLDAHRIFRPSLSFPRRNSPERGAPAFIFLIHGVHHDHPNDPLRLVVPPLLSAPIMLAALLVGRLLFGVAFGLSRD